METKASVVLIDDDPGVQDSVQKLLKSVGLPLTSYTTAHEFLTAIENTGSDTVGCLLLDIRMPGMSGLELQQRLRDSGHDIPTIVVSGHADVPMTVRAIKNGALDFLEKPYNEQVLLDRIQEGMLESERRRVEQIERADILTRMAKLTPREREVLDLLVSGKPNKTIAEKLEISRKTLDIHRGKVLQKMEAETVADLVRMVYKARFYQPRPVPETTL